MRERFLLAGALALGAVIGGNVVVQHEVEQNHQVEILKGENQRLWNEIALLWANGCFVQAEADEVIQGETDITPNKEGLDKCRDYSKKWKEEVFTK